MIASIVFYILGFILVTSSLFVITARNPVHSVLFLILAFFNVAGLFVLLGAEFLAFILAIVYVGAVAVLFLFVVMMLDVSFDDLRKDAMQYIPVGLGVGGVLIAEFLLIILSWRDLAKGNEDSVPFVNPIGQEQAANNTEALGAILYTDYFLVFQISGMILLVAMIGAIVLTLRMRPGVRRQNIAKQVNTKPSDVVEVQKVIPKTGV
jgi:NADH-quinone oxidoreductase subunit J